MFFRDCHNTTQTQIYMNKLCKATKKSHLQNDVRLKKVEQKD